MLSRGGPAPTGHISEGDFAVTKPETTSQPRRGTEPEDTDDGTNLDAGAYIGRLPEGMTETIPGGVGPKDVRVAAVATQPGPVRGEVPGSGDGAPPGGHREGEGATDDRVREAGQDR
jgi:hypothetical protein